MASDKFHSKITYIIIIVTMVFVVVTILFGINATFEFLGVSIPTPDYIDFYIPDWSAVLNGENPYNYGGGFSYYPIGYLIFSGGYAIHPVVPKVIFCIALGYTVFFINGLCKKYDVSQKSTNSHGRPGVIEASVSTLFASLTHTSERLKMFLSIFETLTNSGCSN